MPVSGTSSECLPRPEVLVQEDGIKFDLTSPTLGIQLQFDIKDHQCVRRTFEHGDFDLVSWRLWLKHMQVLSWMWLIYLLFPAWENVQIKIGEVTDGRYTSLWTFLLDSEILCPRNFLHRQPVCIIDHIFSQHVRRFFFWSTESTSTWSQIWHLYTLSLLKGPVYFHRFHRSYKIIS